MLDVEKDNLHTYYLINLYIGAVPIRDVQRLSKIMCRVLYLERNGGGIETLGWGNRTLRVDPCRSVC